MTGVGANSVDQVVSKTKGITRDSGQKIRQKKNQMTKIRGRGV